MPRPDRVAGETDRLAQAPVSRYQAADGYTVCRTAERPDYLFGNCLILDAPPAEQDVAGWLARAAAPFGPATGYAVLQWEQAGRYSGGELPSGALVEHLVLAGEGSDTESPALPDGTRFVAVTSDEQWADLVRFAARETATDEDWTRWRYQQYRALGDACRWLVAVEDGRVVAAGGLVSDARYDRFQEVVTAADRRRRGLATRLCGRLLGRSRSGRVAVAVADPATGAEQVYRALGLAPVGYQYAVLAPLASEVRCDV